MQSNKFQAEGRKQYKEILLDQRSQEIEKVLKKNIFNKKMILLLKKIWFKYQQLIKQTDDALFISNLKAT